MLASLGGADGASEAAAFQVFYEVCFVSGKLLKVYVNTMCLGVCPDETACMNLISMLVIKLFKVGVTFGSN